MQEQQARSALLNVRACKAAAQKEHQLAAERLELVQGQAQAADDAAGRAAAAVVGDEGLGTSSMKNAER